MSNHIKGNWFVSIFKMQNMTQREFGKVAYNDNYRHTTRQNAENLLIDMRFNWLD